MSAPAAVGPAAVDSADLVELRDRARAVVAEVGRRIVGQGAAVEEVVLCLLAGGHGLLEGVPGLGKTLLVRTLAEALDLQFRRVQFTPDLAPSDITGTELLEEDRDTGSRRMRFVRGPIFTQVLLADEINRAPPKTQAALLEAMQEGIVTVAGDDLAVPRPFLVLATQNPIEQEGTWPLPEAQLDRFLLHIHLDYPGEVDEVEIVRQTTGALQGAVRPQLDAAGAIALQALVREVPIASALAEYAVRLVRASRPSDDAPTPVRDWVRWGAGPRAGQALVLAAKARALLAGRLHVSADDLARVAAPVLRHRLRVNFRAEAEGISANRVISELLRAVAPPRSGL